MVNRFYGGKQTPTGRMLEDVARCLIDAGHSVQVLTSQQQSYGGIEAEAGGFDQVQIKAVWTGSGSSRFVQWGVFWLRAILAIPFSRWDRCVVLTDPPFMLYAARFCRRLHRSSQKLFWWTMDLYPEAMIAKGMIRADGLAARILRGMNNEGLRRTTGVIALGPTQRRLLTKYGSFDGSTSGCVVVPPWDHRALPKVERKNNRFLAKFGWAEKKIALYAGNLGEAHSFQNLLDAATTLMARGDDEWLLVFVARGAERLALEAAAQGMANVRILDYQPPELTADLLNAATVHVVTMKRGWEGIIVPSKLYGIAATGIPTLFVGPRDADTAIEIEKLGLGACVDSDAGPDEILSRLEELSMQPRNEQYIMPTDGPRRIADFVCA